MTGASDSSVGLDLWPNAYSFVNESLRCATGATSNPSRWKFALVHASQALELILKERLRREHALLVYTNVDKPRHTVTLELAIERLGTCGVEIPDKEIKDIRSAKELRNAIIHFNIDATDEQFQGAYVSLLEFAHRFHLGEIGDELHPHIDDDLWEKEAELMASFSSEFITYQGETIIKGYPLAIVKSQLYPYFIAEGRRYDRIRYGSEGEFYKRLGLLREGQTIYEQLPNCGDCAVVKGQLHGPECDIETCPKLGHQLLSCDCDWEDGPPWFFEDDWMEPEGSAG
ncbi:hypothetical protein [Amycolatopsis sp. cmx-4-68]|uniref:hypothetical protein n=1 Tax=Amycolatopsis sp. cmx-4-68 TaxID=2790938 RepID=UPI00397A9A88